GSSGAYAGLPAPCALRRYGFLFHLSYMKILKGSTWENLCLRKTFRGGTFSGWKYFQPLKVHLAVCWRILKSGCAGLKV
ncbi:hypothetical protein, partial [Parabacteroides sp.]|uniref:hypothetical protein n=1 Tax=Parabacteroides sp. TaxID=1869337 RepID=UPI0025804609